MKRRDWLKLGKKSGPEPRAEPPIWLGNRSNGEIFEHQTPKDRRIRRLILERADENARRVGIDRREFLASSMGMASSLWALNLASCGSSDGSAPGGNPGNGNGGYCLPEEAQLDEAAACSVLSGDEFIFDGHTHHFDPNGQWRTGSQAYSDGWTSFFNSMTTSFFPDRTLRPCGGAGVECLTRDVYLREFFTESDTTMTVLTMWPSVPCEAATGPDCGLLVAHQELAITRDLINRLGNSQRCVTHVGIAPPFGVEVMSAMMEEACALGVSGWKSYTGFGVGATTAQAAPGYRLTDDIGRAFIEKGLALGVPVFCLHKGLGATGLDPATNESQDIGPAAREYPNAKFVVFHANVTGSIRPDGTPEGPYDASTPTPLGVDVLVRSVLDAGIGPNQNVYADLGMAWALVAMDPTQAAHVLGKLLLYLGENNVLWGTDALPSVHAQTQIEMFRAFEIPEALQAAHGYPALTPELKAKIFGRNLAALYGIDPDAKRCTIAKDDLTAARRALDGELGNRRFTQSVPYGPRTRREFLAFAKLHGGRPG
jgi:predicted TIM-barrel fold metal-dependent hydrolase